MIMKKKKIEFPAGISDSLDQPIDAAFYPELDTDLARDNLENDLPEADKQDL